MSCVARVTLTALLLWPAGPAVAQVSIPLTISGNQAKGTIQLPGGLGADLTLSFENVVGLHPGALAVSARAVNPLDPTLLSRLPVGGQVSVPGGFPVVLRIEPTAQSTLSFSGAYAISLYTQNLHLQPNFPLVLYSGATGGALADITSSVAMGSYRAGGSGGGFSEFVIVADARAIDTVILEKFDALDDAVASGAGSMPASVLWSLQNRAAQARAFHASGATAAAVTEMAAFSDYVKAQSGASIPDVWRAHDGAVNHAGLLRARAATLRFSLNVKGNLTP